MSPDRPRFIPTLTEVVESAPAQPHPQPQPPLAPSAPEATALQDMQDDLAEQIAHRVLQRVDAVLESRLNEAVRAVVARHTEALLPTLREEIVATVQSTVAQALADEFVAPDTSRRPG